MEPLDTALDTGRSFAMWFSAVQCVLAARLPLVVVSRSMPGEVSF